MIYSRSVQKVGNRSYSVTLPKKWVIEKKLNVGDLLSLEENSHGLQLSKSGAKHQASNEIIVDLNNLEYISQFMVYCYVIGISRIVLQYRKYELPKIKEVKSILSYLEGFHIVNEDDNLIEVRFLFNDVNIKTGSIQRRIIYLISELALAVEKKDSDIEKIETTIDRLHNLSKRILSECNHNDKLRIENDISSFEDVYFKMAIFKKLENIADKIYDIRAERISHDMSFYLGCLVAYLKSMLIQDEPPRTLNCKFPKNENKIISESIRSLSNLCQDIFENVTSLKFSREMVEQKSKMFRFANKE